MSQSNIEEEINIIRQGFKSNKTKDIAFRKQQLENIQRGVKELFSEFAEALEQDLGWKNHDYAGIMKIGAMIGAIDPILQNLDKWAQPRDMDTSLLMGNAQSKLLPQPYGTTLVIAAWNFPYYTSIVPASDAIGAGNTVILKTSEMSPNCSRVIKKLFDNYVDPECYRVVEGGAETSIALLEQRWDLIIFTGSPEKGKLVSQAAAKHLTPVVLELGGKCPVIVDQDTDIKMAAQRVAWAKYLNSGQICLTTDYALVHESIKDQFLSELKTQISEYFGQDASKSQDYQRMVNQQHTERVANLINTSGGQKYVGGNNIDVENRFIEPTVIVNPDLDSNILKEEIFGPVLPVMTFNKIEETVEYINKGEKPLSLYFFGKNKSNIQYVEQNTYSGHFVTNDVITQALNHYVPFGGVGNSGQGSLYGIHGFNSCSHLKPITYCDSYNGWPNHIKVPPYNSEKIKMLNQSMGVIKFSKQKVLRGGAFLLSLPFILLGANKLAK